MKDSIAIVGFSTISALGHDDQSIHKAYENSTHALVQTPEGWAAPLGVASSAHVEKIRKEQPQYQSLDASVLYALATSRMAIQQAGWQYQKAIGVNFGSSRGATQLFELHHKEFIEKGMVSTQASPSTTLGNISSWVAHDLQLQGPVISHSITCSTALHALLNGLAWLRSDMCENFIVGGAEAPLTPFTFAQMRALKIYSQQQGSYPCRALDLQKKYNSMVLGEGAAAACLTKGSPKNALAFIEGVGYATETLKHSVSLSVDAKCFQDSMKQALKNTSINEVDAIVMHAPGTRKGDLAEYEAIKKIFDKKIPFLTSNKWKIGHTFGASGLLSLEAALWMLAYQKPIQVPYIDYAQIPTKFSKVLVNAVGFGGNAVSVLISKNSRE